MARRPVSDKYRQQMNQSILEKALEMFLTHGLNSVKMDDISHAMSMSKRTLYEVYSNKEELILESFRMGLEKSRAKLIASISADSNVMDILTEFLRMRVNHARRTNPCILDEIDQYPRVKEFFTGIQKVHSDNITSFLARGQEEGFFIKDLNLEIIREFNQCISQTVRAYKIHQKYAPDEILRCIIITNIRGLCTKAGIERIDHILATL